MMNKNRIETPNKLQVACFTEDRLSYTCVTCSFHVVLFVVVIKNNCLLSIVAILHVDFEYTREKIWNAISRKSNANVDAYG